MTTRPADSNPESDAADTAAETAGGLADRAVRFIEEHVGEQFGVDGLARAMRVSRRTLERSFRESFGETPRVRLMKIRVAAAQRARQADSSQTLAAAARAAGFNGARHLRRAFASLGVELGGNKAAGR